MKEYFIHPQLGKIVVVMKNFQLTYFKEKDKKLKLLSKKDFKTIDKLLKDSKQTIYYSKALNDILIDNPNLQNFDNNATFKYMLECIENIIPVEYRSNFYKNLMTLEIEIGIEYVPLNNEKQDEIKDLGGYDIRHNKITIYKHTLDNLNEYAQTTNNKNETFGREINRIIIHELLHMASSFFEKEKNRIVCGFRDTHSENLNGLTEGFTELLSMMFVPGTLEINSGYYLHALLSKQLLFLVGFDTMIKSYFGLHNSREIEKELNKIEENQSFSAGLIHNIENSFNVLSLGDTPQTFLGSAQNLMIYYFEQKMLKAIEEKTMTKEEIKEYLVNFEQSLITPYILKMNNKKVENYKGIEKSLGLFNNTKEYILSMLEEVEINTNK